MGPIKSLGELQDSIMKLRENFDFMLLGKGVVMVPPKTTSAKKLSCLLEGANDDSCC